MSDKNGKVISLAPQRYAVELLEELLPRVRAGEFDAVGIILVKSQGAEEKLSTRWAHPGRCGAALLLIAGTVDLQHRLQVTIEDCKR